MIHDHPAEGEAMAEGVTAAEIEAAKTVRGGWTRAQLAVWGVPWPPPKGWKKKLIEKTRQKEER
jgi:hypothetical protein